MTDLQAPVLDASVHNSDTIGRCVNQGKIIPFSSFDEIITAHNNCISKGIRIRHRSIQDAISDLMLTGVTILNSKKLYQEMVKFLDHLDITFQSSRPGVQRSSAHQKAYRLEIRPSGGDVKQLFMYILNYGTVFKKAVRAHQRGIAFSEMFVRSVSNT